MIVKERDATDTTLAHLERMELTEQDSELRSTIRHARARLRASTTTDNACSVIDALFADTPEWMVLHDLRLCVKNRMFYANHLLINDVLEFFVIDSRYIQYGLTVDDSGTWRAHSNASSSVIASPVNKLNRDLRFLKTHLKTNDVLPRYFGLLRPGSIKGYILTNPAIRSGKPRGSDVDISPLVASDALFSLIWKEPEHWLGRHLKPEPAENLQRLASKLGQMHSSGMPEVLRERDLAATNVPALDTDTAHCSDCGQGICESVREQCFRHMLEFKGRILCTVCQAKYLDHRPMFASY